MNQALNTLGNTKWRINKRVLGVIDRIWASGGRLADLVDREDVSCILKALFSLFSKYYCFLLWKRKTYMEVRYSNKCPIQHHAPGFILNSLFMYTWV